MSTVTLPEILHFVSDLPPDDQQALYDDPGELRPHPKKPVVQVAGTLGTAIPEEAGDLIAEELATLRRERNANLDAEWDRLPSAAVP
jgi:hypothetical protein